ncbi:hypothetical protein QBC38DRAFT_485672 [Podospora fimiseda]|uniref:Uncharacterized protein n=1 Tax=Podospora fimiseda TaxID=252190 RepID=A0AAN7BJF3_9PEZI|nr:hypothetical protein QBC38DRAFT_485672 [Podospora fimiseda]
MDPDGDLILSVGSDGQKREFQVDAATLRRISPVYKIMLFGKWAESKPADGREWVVALPEDEPSGRHVLDFGWGMEALAWEDIPWGFAPHSWEDFVREQRNEVVKKVVKCLEDQVEGRKGRTGWLYANRDIWSVTKQSFSWAFIGNNAWEEHGIDKRACQINAGRWKVLEGLVKEFAPMPKALNDATPMLLIDTLSTRVTRLKQPTVMKNVVRGLSYRLKSRFFPSLLKRRIGYLLKRGKR